MKPGYAISGSLDGPLVTSVSIRGTHGYAPDHPELSSSFFLTATRIPKGVNLGPIDMRYIAPTLARIMEVSLPSADLPPLSMDAKAASQK